MEFEREEKAACGGDTEWGGWVPWLPEDRQFSYGRRYQAGSLRKERAAVSTTTSPVLVSTAVLILGTAAIASFGQDNLAALTVVGILSAWNDCYIRAINGEVRLWVNAKKSPAAPPSSPAKGSFAWKAKARPFNFASCACASCREGGGSMPCPYAWQGTVFGEQPRFQVMAD